MGWKAKASRPIVRIAEHARQLATEPAIEPPLGCCARHEPHPQIVAPTGTREGGSKPLDRQTVVGESSRRPGSWAATLKPGFSGITLPCHPCSAVEAKLLSDMGELLGVCEPPIRHHRPQRVQSRLGEEQPGNAGGGIEPH